MAKFALIINGDTETRHLKNVEQSLFALSNEGYETFVASAKTPANKCDHYVKVDDISGIISQLKEKCTDKDELVIYVTGHGLDSGFCLESNCNTQNIAKQLDEFKFAQRVVVMDQCFGGNFASMFHNDPSTLFMSAGAKNDTTCCEEFTPFFWSDKVPDKNNDGVISWKERFVNGAGNITDPRAKPVFLPSVGFKDKGEARFPTDVVKISTESEFKKLVDDLGPGEYMILDYTATWCGPCKEFGPKYQEMAKLAQGAYLFAKTENILPAEHSALSEAHGIHSYPTLIIYGHNGEKFTVDDHESLMVELAEFSANVPNELKKYIIAMNTRYATFRDAVKKLDVDEDNLPKISKLYRECFIDMQTLRDNSFENAGDKSAINNVFTNFTSSILQIKNLWVQMEDAGAISSLGHMFMPTIPLDEAIGDVEGMNRIHNGMVTTRIVMPGMAAAVGIPMVIANPLNIYTAISMQGLLLLVIPSKEFKLKQLIGMYY